MNNEKQQLQTLLIKLTANAQKFRRYSLIIFIVFVGLLYGFILFRINTLNSQEPSEAAISSQVKAAKIPHIDLSVIKQLETLQDNSVNVKALFNEARSNPFQ